MEQLIEALQIFLKYGNPDYPTYCEHDQMFVMIDPHEVSEEDKGKLDALGFTPYGDTFSSFRYGSA